MEYAGSKSVFQSDNPVSVMVIDNGSIDGTQSYLESLTGNIIFCQQESNIGFGAANNIGLNYAIANNYDYVYLLNQDAWIEPDTIRGLITVHRENKSYGILSPLQMNAEKTAIDKNLSDYITNKTCSGIVDDLLHGVLKNVYEINFVMAAHWLVSKDCLKRIGGFSPMFFHYGEDNNYVQRVSYHGFKIGLCPLLQVVHDREFRVMPGNKEAYMIYSSQFLTWVGDIRNAFLYTFLLSYIRLIYKKLRQAIENQSFYPLLFMLKGIASFNKIVHCRKMSYDKSAFFIDYVIEVTVHIQYLIYCMY